MTPVILIVEDERDLLTTLEYNLEREGYRTRTAYGEPTIREREGDVRSTRRGDGWAKVVGRLQAGSDGRGARQRGGSHCQSRARPSIDLNLCGDFNKPLAGR